MQPTVNESPDKQNEEPQPYKPPQVAKVIKDRISVVEAIYHQSPDEQPMSVESRFEIELASSGEQPYIRTRQKVGGNWSLVETGWAHNPVMIVIKNEEGRYTVNPTDEERQNVESRVLHVGIGDEVHMLTIGPRESLRLPIAGGSKVYIRCANYEARYTVYAFNY